MGNSDRYTKELEVIKQEIEELQSSQRVVTSPEELVQLEREIRRLTERLASALLGQKVQECLDTAEVQEKEQEMVKSHPKRLKSEGKKRSRYVPRLGIA